MDGFLIIDKPEGPTSHDIVNRIRRAYGTKKVGHAGTLDPIATGVLAVAVGSAVRMVEYLVGEDKEYVAGIALGIETDSQDRTGEVLSQKDASCVTRERFESACAEFAGEIDQVPPMKSAIKKNGVPLYKLALKGETIEREARRITVHSIAVESFEPGAEARGVLRVRCSSGTYIRTLCADIGAQLGCGAIMTSLRRTSVGRFPIEKAYPIDEIEASDDRSQFLIPTGDALSDFPSATLDSGELIRALHGNTTPLSTDYALGDTIRMYDCDGRFLGIGISTERDGELLLQPKKMLYTN